MKSKDSLSAALKLVLQKNWLHREECLDKLQQFVEPEPVFRTLTNNKSAQIASLVGG